MVSGEDDRILRRDLFSPVFLDLLFVILPDGIKNIHGLIHRKREMHISQRIQCHIFPFFPKIPCSLVRQTGDLTFSIFSVLR